LPHGLASADWRIWAAAGAFLLAVVTAFFVLRRRGRRPWEREFEAHVEAVRALLADDLDAAVRALTAAAELNSERPSTYLALGRLLRRKGDVDRALRIHGNLAVRPDLPADVRLESRLEVALDDLAARRPRQALEALKEVLAARRKDPSALAAAAEAHLALDQWEDAYEMVRRLDQVTERARPALMAHLLAAHGRELMGAGNLPAAKKSLQKALSVHAQSVDALLALGDVYLADGKARRAIETWERIFEIDSRWVEILTPRLEQAFLALGEADRLEGLLRRQIALRPHDAGPCLVLARFFEKERRLQDALGALKQALDLDPASLPARRARGKLLLARGGSPALESAFAALLHALPEDPPPFRCEACGATYREPVWRCKSCHAWDTVRFSESAG
jgi:lipopolysaccharide biosynthesis regulator YciM